MFLFKKKKLVLDCFTYRPDVYAYFPIERASKNMPEWWKNTPPTAAMDNINLVEIPTIKSCVGLINYYSNAISIPMWSDCKIVTSIERNEINWFFSDLKTNCVSHHHSQNGNYFHNSTSVYAHMKINSPWAFKCNEDIKFVFTGNTWAIDNPERIVIPPGVIDFKYQNSTNINMFVKIDDNSAIFNANTSLVHVFPMTEREIDIRNHHVSEKEFDDILDMSRTNYFSKSYLKHRTHLKNKEKSSKCPVSSLFKT